MRAVAHNPAFAKKVGIPQSVGEDFSKADKDRKFGAGGNVKKEMKAAKILSNQSLINFPKQLKNTVLKM